MVAKTILIPHRRETGAHGRQSGPGGFYQGGIVLEMDALAAGRTGVFQLYDI